jgi:hypothetical protein
MSEFTKQDAEDAGWVIVHEGIDEEVEGATLNASHWRAEKYLNQPGRAGAFVEVAAPTEERLYESIAHSRAAVLGDGRGPRDRPVRRLGRCRLGRPLRRQHLRARLRRRDSRRPAQRRPARPERPGPTRTATSRASTSARATASAGGVRDRSPAVPSRASRDDDDGNLSPSRGAARAGPGGHRRGEVERDNADSPEEADGADAAQAPRRLATTRRAATRATRATTPRSCSRRPVQPPTPATASSRQVPDSEAAESDTERTNTDAPGDKPAESQDEIAGPDSDSVSRSAPRTPRRATCPRAPASPSTRTSWAMRNRPDRGHDRRRNRPGDRRAWRALLRSVGRVVRSSKRSASWTSRRRRRTTRRP